MSNNYKLQFLCYLYLLNKISRNVLGLIIKPSHRSYQIRYLFEIPKTVTLNTYFFDLSLVILTFSTYIFLWTPIEKYFFFLLIFDQSTHALQILGAHWFKNNFECSPFFVNYNLYLYYYEYLGSFFLDFPKIEEHIAPSFFKLSPNGFLQIIIWNNRQIFRFRPVFENFFGHSDTEITLFGNPKFENHDFILSTFVYLLILTLLSLFNKFRITR